MKASILYVSPAPKFIEAIKAVLYKPLDRPWLFISEDVVEQASKKDYKLTCAMKKNSATTVQLRKIPVTLSGPWGSESALVYLGQCTHCHNIFWSASLNTEYGDMFKQDINYWRLWQ